MPSYACMPPVSAQYSIILRVEIDHRPGMLGRVATAIGDAGGSIGSVDLSAIDGLHTIRDITIDTAGEEHAQRIAAAVDAVDGARLIDTSRRPPSSSRRISLRRTSGCRNSGCAAK